MAKTAVLREALKAYRDGVPSMTAEDLLALMHKYSVDQLVHEWLDIPADKRVVVTVDNKNAGAHRGRRSCVVCKGGLTEVNQLSIPMKLAISYEGEKRDLYCYVLVCGAECEIEIKRGRWAEKKA